MTLFIPKRDGGTSRYCGPTAIMAVTGEPGSVVRDAIRQVRGNIMTVAGHHAAVTGLSNSDLLGTMSALGWAVVESWNEPLATLKFDENSRAFKRPSGFKPLAFCDFLKKRGADGPFIVNVTGHYVAVSHGEVCEAAETPLPIDIERYLTKGKRAYRNAWVRRWWKFTAPTPAADRGEG